MKAKDLQEAIRNIRLSKDDECKLRTAYKAIKENDVDFNDFCALMTQLLGLIRTK
jgi:hypothetical protein